MNKHTVLKHDCWYHPKRDEYVQIAPEDLEHVRARYRSWQSHRPQDQSADRKRSRPCASDECRPVLAAPPSTTVVTTRDLRVTLERCSTPAPVTVLSDEPIPSTSCGPERTTRSRGRGYGILGPDYATGWISRISATKAIPPTPASGSQPPWSSSSDSDDDSDITVLDIEAETDVAVVGWGRYSDVSEPASPSAAATLDRAATRASAATAAAAQESDSINEDSEFGMLSTLDLPELAPVCSSSVFSSQSVDESLQPGLEGPSARDAVKFPVGTFLPLEGVEDVGVGHTAAVNVEQSVSVGVEQAATVGVAQSTNEAVPSTGILDINRAAGPTPGAGGML